MSIRFLSCLLLSSSLFFFPLAASAAGPVVAEALGVSVTADDLEADAQRIPPNQRAEVVGSPNNAQQTSSNLLTRRALAAEAVRDGLDKDPVVAAALQIQRDRLLSDLRLLVIDAANKPSDETVEAAARAAYRADPSKFTTREQVRVRHILIAGTTDEAKAAATKILADLKAGANFEEMAKQKSADQANAHLGGDLGYFETSRMVPEFEEAVLALKKPGDLSGLVQTKFGWHIIKLEAVRPGGTRTYEEVSDELRKTVRAQLQSDARLREAERIVKSMKFNRENIEAFSARYRKQ
jgi:peptidyl-prolyl cis-trans isomerase C